MEKIANAKNDQELSAFWNDVKGQDDEKVRRLEELVKNHVKKNVSNLIGPLSRRPKTRHFNGWLRQHS